MRLSVILLSALVLSAALTVGLEWAYKYHFFFIEQSQLFLFSWDWLVDTLRRRGGVVDAAAGFVVQFFAFPWAGAAIVAVLSTGVGLLAALICRRFVRRRDTSPRPNPAPGPSRVTRRLPGWAPLVVMVVFTAGAVVFALKISRADPSEELLKTLDHHARAGDWDAVIAEFDGPVTNLLYLNYLNLALSHKGVLADDLFKYDQRDPRGLLVPWNKTRLSSTVLSDIHFHIGTVSTAQQMAFEGYVGTPGSGNPRMLQRLVQTNLVFGAWPVAEKYLDILSKTLAYRGWAARHRRFLGNDAAVEADSLLGKKRRCLPLPVENRLATDLALEVEAVARRNPQSRTAIEYLGAMMLLTKELNAFGALLDRYYGTPVLPALPRSFAEAVVLIHEGDPAAWDRYGVSTAVVDGFAAFRERLARSGGRQGTINSMRGSHGDTYWFYYMFK